MSFEGGSALSSTLITFLLGLGIVFIGLIALIVIIKIMGAIMRGVSKKKPAPVKESAPEVKPVEPQGDLGEIKAAAAAAIATLLGESVKGIRIVSFKKLD
jgi:sodium pump decarboxylase gamma subunit